MSSDEAGIARALKAIEKRLAKLEAAMGNGALRRKAKAYDETKEALSALLFHVQNIKTTVDSQGKDVVTVTYAPNKATMSVDGDGNVYVDPTIQAMNLLGLIPYSEMEEIQDALDKISNK